MNNSNYYVQQGYPQQPPPQQQQQQQQPPPQQTNQYQDIQAKMMMQNYARQQQMQSMQQYPAMRAVSVNSQGGAPSPSSHSHPGGTPNLQQQQLTQSRPPSAAGGMINGSVPPQHTCF